MIEEILKDTRKKMEKTLEIAREDLATVRIDRARPALVETIKVGAYEGTVLQIKELANITASGPHQIIISPWDKSITKKIAQAISNSDLNLSPIVDEEVIRLKISPLTEERRREVEKLVEMKIESGRKMIRNIRNEVKSEIEELKGEGGVSEDDIFRWRKDLQELHDEFIKKIEELGEEKKKELTL